MTRSFHPLVLAGAPTRLLGNENPSPFSLDVPSRLGIQPSHCCRSVKGTGTAAVVDRSGHRGFTSYPGVRSKNSVMTSVASTAAAAPPSSGENHVWPPPWTVSRRTERPPRQSDQFTVVTRPSVSTLELSRLPSSSRTPTRAVGEPASMVGGANVRYVRLRPSIWSSPYCKRAATRWATPHRRDPIGNRMRGGSGRQPGPAWLLARRTRYSRRSGRYWMHRGRPAE